MAESVALVLPAAARRARRSTPTALHVALTRSAAVRLAPVADALRGPQTFLDAAGNIVRRSDTQPVLTDDRPRLSAAAAARAVTAALEATGPDVALVAGDGELALAATLAATRVGVPVARIGAGLRCGDRNAAREINRVAIDELACRLYTDDADASERLRTEGLDERRVQFVGSTVPDTIGRWLGEAHERAVWARLGRRRRDYVVVTLSGRDIPAGTADGIRALAQRIHVVVCEAPAPQRVALFPEPGSPVTVVETRLAYVEFLSLLSAAAAVVTDSSGVQDEATVLRIPCYTLARTSERTLTLTHGTNVLLGDDGSAIADVLTDDFIPETEPIPLWDGAAGQRIADDLMDHPWSERG